MVHVVLQAESLKKKHHLKNQPPLWAMAVLGVEPDSAGAQHLLHVRAILGVDRVAG